MTVAQDGNNNIFPVVFAIVEGETADGWGFFLKNLRIHVAPQPDLCLISDGHASIESAYNNPENGWHNPPSFHVYCIRHIAQNFVKEIKDRSLRKTMINMGKSILYTFYVTLVHHNVNTFFLKPYRVCVEPTDI